MLLRARGSLLGLRLPMLLAVRNVTTLPRCSAVRLDGDPPRWEAGTVRVYADELVWARFLSSHFGVRLKPRYRWAARKIKMVVQAAENLGYMVLRK